MPLFTEKSLTSIIEYDKLSKDKKYKRTGDYLEDVRRIKEKQDRIEEEILKEIVYA